MRRFLGPALLPALLVTLSALGLMFYGPRVLADDTPSVLLIIIDTLRADHLGCFGYERNTSPNLDALAGHSILFGDAISAAPWTTPSIASMFTGQYPRVLGYGGDAVVVDDKALCMAEIFKLNGYATGAVISHTFVSSELGFDQGFESFDEENDQGHGHVSSPSVTDKGIAFVDAHKGGRFFLFLHYFDPHCDYILHQPYDFYPDYQGDLKSGQTIESLREAAPHMTAEDKRYLNALYDSEIRFTDENIGRLLEHLKTLGIYDDLLIVVVADHGEAFLERGEHWIGHTTNVHQELVHVPFMIKLPGQAEGRRIDRPVSLVDFMPTVIHAAGLEVPAGYEYDARDLLGPDSGDGTTPVFSETYRWGDQESLISSTWKILKDRASGHLYLFDLGSDPCELRDLSADKREILLKLRARLSEIDYDLDMGRSRFRVRAPNLSPEEIEKLKSLGYIR
jgi:arylsulfatase A-like enzyme